jgi:hypothetical protein
MPHTTVLLLDIIDSNSLHGPVRELHQDNDISYQIKQPACEDLLHASTSPQVETAHNCELARRKGNEGGRRYQRAAHARRDRSWKPRDLSITLCLATTPLLYFLRRKWNHSSEKDPEDSGI